MRISQAGLDLIKRFEGLSLTAYKDVAGVPTIGYGTTRYPNGSMVRLGDKCTEAQAGEYLREAVIGCEEAVSQYIGVPLSQAQFDALVSLVYNVGAGAFSESTLRRKLNAADYRGAAVEFDRWVYAGGRKIEGLIKRRRAERELFESGLDVPQSGAPVPGAGTPPVAETATYLAGEAAYSAPLKQEPPLLKLPPWPFNNPPSEVRMAFPLLPTLLAAAAQAIPDLIRLGGDGERSERNAQLAERVMPIIVQATGATNAQDAVERIQSDPAARDAAQRAIREHWFELQEIGGGIEKAREHAAKLQGDKPAWMNPALWVSGALLPIPYVIMFAVIFGSGHSKDVQIMVIQAAIGVLMSVGAFWLGSTFGSQRKDETRNR